MMLGAVGILAAVAVSVALARLEPAAPSVERDTVWIGVVERGPMLRQVRGNGTLVPEELRWIPARTSGRVEQILVQPGERVASDDVLLELSNPEVEQAALNARSVLKRADANLNALRVKLASSQLNHQAAAAAVESDYVQATLRAEANRELAERGLISSINLKISEALAESLATRRRLEQERLAMTSEANQAELDAETAEVERQQTMYQLRSDQEDSLKVRAGLAGVVQEVPIEVGQQVAPGASLALVAEPSKLKAELRIPATQARDVQVGQAATIDTRNGVIPGVVARIDPAVREGTVTVDVNITGPLPRGARPDLSVDGTIEIERLDDVLYVGRPAFGQEGATLGLFRLGPDGVHAMRAQVSVGRSSVKTIEVISGLNEGDQVILSDTSRWDEYDRIRLE